jgi:WD40 repeat protein
VVSSAGALGSPRSEQMSFEDVEQPEPAGAGLLQHQRPQRVLRPLAGRAAASWRTVTWRASSAYCPRRQEEGRASLEWAPPHGGLASASVRAWLTAFSPTVQAGAGYDGVRASRAFGGEMGRIPHLANRKRPDTGPVAGDSNSPESSSDVFISYSRRDRTFVERLAAALQDQGWRVWVDIGSLRPGQDWWAAITEEIEKADGVVFVLSPDAVLSRTCTSEFLHAAAHRKRVIPVICRAVSPAAIPAAASQLKDLHWVAETPNRGFKGLISDIDQALRTDLEGVRVHTRLLSQALSWDRAEGRRKRASLLRGANLQAAEEWLREADAEPDVRREPQPTQTQRAFINASRRATVQRRWTAGATTLVVALMTLGLLWVINLRSHEARSRARAAEATVQLRVNPELGLLLAREAVRAAPTIEARAVLRQALLESHLRLTLRGHQTSVAAAAFDPKGEQNRIVTASFDGTARIWDAQTGAAIPPLPNGEILATALPNGWPSIRATAEFSRDGRWAVATVGQAAAQVLEVETGAVVARLSHDRTVQSAHFSRDSRRIVTAGIDGVAKLWVFNGKIWTLDMESMPLLVGDDQGLNSAVFSPDGGKVLTAGASGTASVWNIQTSRRLRLPNSAELKTAEFSPDGRQVLVASVDGTARIWDLRHPTSKPLILRGNGSPLNAAVFSRDGRQVAAARHDGSTTVWDARSGRSIATLLGHLNPVMTAVFSADGKRVLTASLDHTARVWDISSETAVLVLRGHARGLQSAAFDHDGSRLVTSGLDGTARVWDVAIPDDPAISLPRGRGTAEATYSPDGYRLVTADFDNGYLWNAGSGEHIGTLSGHRPNTGVDTAFSDNGKLLVTSSSDGTARVWDGNSGRLLKRLGEQQDGLYQARLGVGNGMVVKVDEGQKLTHLVDILTGQTRRYIPGLVQAFSRDLRYALVADASNRAHVHDTVTNRNISLAGPAAGGPAVAFSRDGTLVAAPGEPETVHVWNTQTGARVAVLQGHNGSVTSTHFSADGRSLLTTSEDGTARVWAVRDERRTALLSGHVDWVTSGAFNPDASLAVTGGTDGTVRVWDVNTGASVLVLDSSPEQNDRVVSTSFSPDGRQILTATTEGFIRIFACEVCGPAERLTGLADYRLQQAKLGLTSAQRE